MYVKVIVINRKENEDEWKHASTAIYEADKIRITDMKDGSRELAIYCNHDEGPVTISLLKPKDTEKVDVFVENEKGDTISRY